MKAILHTRYGPPDELQLQEVEKPTPGNHDVLFKIHATTVTSTDCNMRNLTFVSRLFRLPVRLFMVGALRPKTKELVEAGKIEPVIDRIYPLEHVAEAFRYVERGHKKGNVVITVAHSDE